MGRRRKLPKRTFSARDSSSYVRVSRIDPNKAFAYNQQRSKATEGGRGDTEHKLDGPFMQEIPPTKSLSTYDHDLAEWVRSERGLVVDRKHALIRLEQTQEQKNSLSFYRVWQSARRQGVADYQCVMLNNVPEKQIRYMLFFSGNEAILVLEVQQLRMISETFEGRRAAITAYKNNKIRWVIKESMVSK